MRPLEPAEREVAKENLWIVDAFLKKNRLPYEEWYDVVIFRYLLTVENWFNNPRLYRYEFSTIAWKAMSSAVYNERKKQERRIQTISLEELVPGSEDLTWGDTITYENLNYIF